MLPMGPLAGQCVRKRLLGLSHWQLCRLPVRWISHIADNSFLYHGLQEELRVELRIRLPIEMHPCINLSCMFSEAHKELQPILNQLP